MRDVSDWQMVGFGVDSTLEKNELLSPQTFPDESEEHRRFIIKYAREFKMGVSWEDITELIASKIGKMLGLNMMDVELVIRNGRRGALLRNFVPLKGQFLEGGIYLSDLEENDSLLSTELTGKELIHFGLSQIEKLSFWSLIKSNFVEMNIFDIFIGNQDRHPYNWMMIYQEDKKIEFSPIYDNGASLGFRFDDLKLSEYISEESKLLKYIGNTKVKAGLFERKQVKAIDLAEVLKLRYSNECIRIVTEIEKFNVIEYNRFIDRLEILSELQREWLKMIIPSRRENILQLFREGES